MLIESIKYIKKLNRNKINANCLPLEMHVLISSLFFKIISPEV